MTTPEDSFAMEEEAIAGPRFTPSGWLSLWLLIGTGAALAAGGLSMASSIVELAQGKVAGFSPAHALGAIMILPLALVLRTFWSLGRESGSNHLQKSALCLFGVIVLSEVFEWASLNIFSPAGVIAALVAVAIGLLMLILTPFLPIGVADPAAAPAAVEPASKKEEIAATPEATQTTAKAGIAGGGALFFFIILKALGKGFLFKLFAFRLVGKLFRNLNMDVVTIIFFSLFALGPLFLIWFAVTKMRLRRKLGAMAVWVGTLELVGLAIYLAVLISFLALLFPVLQKPGATQKEVEQLTDQWLPALTQTTIIVSSGWAVLTACFFIAVRQRGRSPHEDDTSWV